MIFVVITMSFLATLAIIGLVYLAYEIFMDRKKSAETLEDENRQADNLRFKKPKL